VLFRSFEFPFASLPTTLAGYFALGRWGWRHALVAPLALKRLPPPFPHYTLVGVKRGGAA